MLLKIITLNPRALNMKSNCTVRDNKTNQGISKQNKESHLKAAVENAVETAGSILGLYPLYGGILSGFPTIAAIYSLNVIACSSAITIFLAY